MESLWVGDVVGERLRDISRSADVDADGRDQVQTGLLAAEKS